MLKTPTACRHLMRASNAAASFMTGPSSLLTSDSSPGLIYVTISGNSFWITSRFPKKSLTACNWVRFYFTAKAFFTSCWWVCWWGFVEVGLIGLWDVFALVVESLCFIVLAHYLLSLVCLFAFVASVAIVILVHVYALLFFVFLSLK